MLVSDCCNAHATDETCQDVGICPKCREHCEFVDDATFDEDLSCEGCQWDRTSNIMAANQAPCHLCSRRKREDLYAPVIQARNAKRGGNDEAVGS